MALYDESNVVKQFVEDLENHINTKLRTQNQSGFVYSNYEYHIDTSFFEHKIGQMKIRIEHDIISETSLQF